MSFDPLGGWNPNGPLDPRALAAAQAFIIPNAAIFEKLKGPILRIYLHWAVEAFGCLDAQYNLEVDLENGEWVMKVTHDPRDNAPGLDDNAEAAHTWHRNTGALGIAITGMDGASEHDFGPDGVQRHELEFLCALAALVCLECGIEANGRVAAPGTNHLDNNRHNVNTTGEHNLLTHGECAVIDMYPGERWDLGSFVALPDGVDLTPEMRTRCGDALRTRAHLYKAALAHLI